MLRGKELPVGTVRSLSRQWNAIQLLTGNCIVALLQLQQNYVYSCMDSLHPLISLYFTVGVGLLGKKKKNRTLTELISTVAGYKL